MCRRLLAGTIPDMSAPPPRTALAALLAGAALALAAFPATAAAAPPPTYSVVVYANSVEKASLEQPGFPDRCKTWTQARSTFAYSIRSRSAFVVGLVRNPVTDSVFAVMPRGPVPMADTMRVWSTRAHVADNTSDCAPCGPNSEYGLCTGALPDVRDADDCGGEGERRRGALVLSVVGGALSVTGTPQADLSRCRAPRNGVIPLGPGDPRFAPVTVPGAVRRMLAMRVGERIALRRELRRGDCARLRGIGLRTCAERGVLIRATRLR